MDSKLFIHIDDRDCTYYDVYTFAEHCLKEVGFNLKKDKDNLIYPMLMLILAIAWVGGKPLPQIKKYPEMLRFALLFRDEHGLKELISMFDGSYVYCGVLLLHNQVMTENDFYIYEQVVYHYFQKEESLLNEAKWKSIQAEYDAAKKQVLKSYVENESITYDINSNDVGESVNCKNILDSPHNLAKYLKRYVVGQDEAVDTLANVTYQYTKYVKNNKKPPKSYNVLIIGKSGTGKTTIMNALDNLISVTKLDCTGVTESGFKGIDAKDLIKNSTYGKVVFYDEYDKILMPVFDRDHDTHKEVQSCFYKMMEDPKPALNVFAGAFEGLDEIVKKRIKSNHSRVGFSFDGYNSEYIYDDSITLEDLHEFGATYEFLGRIDVIIKMRDFGEGDYYKIITESEYSPIKLEKAIAKDCYDIDLDVGDDFIKDLSAKASEHVVGARALKQYISRVVDPILARGMVNNCSRIVLNSLEGEPEFIK